MSNSNLKRRIEKLAAAIAAIATRLEVLSEAVDTKETTKSSSKKSRAKRSTKKGKAKPKAKATRNRDNSAVGKSVSYHGVKCRVAEKKGDKFILKSRSGQSFKASVTYVYRQLAA